MVNDCVIRPEQVVGLSAGLQQPLSAAWAVGVPHHRLE